MSSMADELRLRVDPMGGLAGDMFLAALLDLTPGAEPAMREAVTAVAPEVDIEVAGHHDGVLTGRRVQVRQRPSAHHDHDHRHFATIRRLISDAAMPAGARDRALDIFRRLAEAEARVHGLAIDDVTFHEVGAWDSIADIVGCAVLLDQLRPVETSVTPIPLGAGRVKTAHGYLPVPAPATALLLEGMPVIDDGITGERVTPTGAAILAHLEPVTQHRGPLGRFAGTGVGFGTRRLPGLANVTRLIAFRQRSESADIAPVGCLTFEVDDQSPEDLAIGLERLRAIDGILDVVQAPVFGKKNRLAAQIQVLTRPEAMDRAADACFTETTTLGIRCATVSRRTLRRRELGVEADGTLAGVKMAHRGADTWTAKIDADALRDLPGQGARAARRRVVEDAAERLVGRGENDGEWDNG